MEATKNSPQKKRNRKCDFFFSNGYDPFNDGDGGN